MRFVTDADLYQFHLWETEWKEFVRSRRLRRGQSSHWNWIDKPFLFASHQEHVLGALVGQDDRCHGMMLITWATRSRLVPDRNAVHVEYLEVAPWNRRGFSEREYRGIGMLLLSYAIAWSEELDMNGRVNLCSLPQAESFYERIGFVEVGVGDGQQANMKFFELEAVTADAFLRTRRQR